MSREIEHKYLVINDSYRAMSTRSVIIRQGYLCREPDRTVRVRIAGNKAFLTIKGRTSGDVRAEYEYPIPKEDASELIKMCTGRIIEKCRYYVPYSDYIWEVDEFCGCHSGLVIAEIELEESGEEYPLPPFVGANVTGQPEYFNSNLT